MKVIEEFVINGYKAEDVMLIRAARCGTSGQLNDLEIVSPVTSAATADDWNKIIRTELRPRLCQLRRARRNWAFDHRRDPARHGGDAKPVLPEDRIGGSMPPKGGLPHAAFYRHKEVGGRHRSGQMEALGRATTSSDRRSSNPDATTFVVPDGFRPRSVNRLFHLKEVNEETTYEHDEPQEIGFAC